MAKQTDREKLDELLARSKRTESEIQAQRNAMRAKACKQLEALPLEEADARDLVEAVRCVLKVGAVVAVKLLQDVDPGSTRAVSASLEADEPASLSRASSSATAETGASRDRTTMPNGTDHGDVSVMG